MSGLQMSGLQHEECRKARRFSGEVVLTRFFRKIVTQCVSGDAMKGSVCKRRRLRLALKRFFCRPQRIVQPLQHKALGLQIAEARHF